MQINRRKYHILQEHDLVTVVNSIEILELNT